MLLDVTNMDFKQVNQAIRQSDGDCHLTGCCGQRFIAAGMRSRTVTIEGIPGNALGAYLDGAHVIVHANAQDAVGDTMNDGTIVVHGSIGDAAGYAMRGGKIYIKGDAGYRAGIHMKEYRQKVPVMIIGGTAGSFLGEYQAGGLIVVLGMNRGDHSLVGNFPCTGMHGGKVLLCGDVSDIVFPHNVCVRRADSADLACIREPLSEFCARFGYDVSTLLDMPFTLVTPDSRNPYKQMYVAN